MLTPLGVIVAEGPYECDSPAHSKSSPCAGLKPRLGLAVAERFGLVVLFWPNVTTPY